MVGRYLIAIAVVAFTIGALYRASYIYNMGILRMYGSFGILLIGYFGTALIRHVQVSRSHDRTFEQLKVWEERGVPLIGLQKPIAGKRYPNYILITDKIWCIMTNDMPNYGGGLSARGLVNLSLKDAATTTRHCEDLLQELGIGGQELVPVVLFTRRSIKRVQKGKKWEHVLVANIEQLNEWLENDVTDAQKDNKWTATRAKWHQRARHIVTRLNELELLQQKQGNSKQRLSEAE